MGSNISTEPVILRGQPEYPINFSESLVDQLQRKQSGHGQPIRSDEEIERIVQSRLKKEREKMAAIDQFREQEMEKVNSMMATRKVEDLLEQQPSYPYFNHKEEYIKAHDSLLSCYKKNSKQPLQCWKEVEDFKKTMDKARNEFLGK